jgi:transcriptional antiterminator NusG
MKWYVIKVMSGKEKKMKEMIEHELKFKNSQHIISKLLIPSEKSLQVRNGKKINVEKNIYPGYILVECESINDVESNIKHVIGVSSVLKQPLSQTEIDRILGIHDKKAIEDVFCVNQKVKITDGAFESFIGEIRELDLNKEKAKICILIFGKEVLLDMTFQQFVKEEK